MCKNWILGIYYGSSAASRKQVIRWKATSRILFLITSVLGPFASGASGLELEGCRSETFLQPPPWATSGLIDESREELIVADQLAKALLIYSDDGGIVSVAREFEWPARDQRLLLKWISTINEDVDGRIYVEDEDQDLIVRLDKGRQFVESATEIQLEDQKISGSSRYSLMAIRDWKPMHRGFVAFGDFRRLDVKGPGQYGSAFLHFDDSGILKVYTNSLDPPNSEREHYLRKGLRYIATIDGETAYILRMTDIPSLAKVSLKEGLRPLGPLPTDFSGVPRLSRDLPSMEAPRQATQYYKIYEKSKMPQGIYAWQGGLYLLAKDSISREGETDWWLIELDPERGTEKVGARLKLPTVAAHLSLVWGESQVALIEKAPVVGTGSEDSPFMDASKVVFFPTDWIKDRLGSPLSEQNSAGLQLSCAASH